MAKTKRRRKLVDDIKKKATTKIKRPRPLPATVSTGSTLLNLAGSEQTTGAFQVGKLINIIGDSFAGKTLLALTILAELANSKNFDEHDLIYDDVEHACTFDIRTLFGSKFKDRMMAPDYTSSNVEGIYDPVYSSTIQSFQSMIFTRLKKVKPFVWVLDSLDGITSDEELARMEAEAKDGKQKGSYKTEVPKILSSILRVVIEKMAKTGSTLIIISQTRDNIGALMFEPKTKRSGGRALKFYSSHEIWLTRAGSLKKRDRVIGNSVKAKLTKNKITGKMREVVFRVYNEYGIDDISSCIDFLLTEEVWKKVKQKIYAKGLTDKQMSHWDLVDWIEEDKGRYRSLKKLVRETWMEIEDSLSLDRRPKYE